MSLVPPSRRRNARPRRPRHRRSLVAEVKSWGRLTVVALALVVAILAALLLVTQLVYQPRVERAVEASVAAGEAHEAMLEREVAVLGYQSTGDREFEQLYEEGTEQLAGWNATMAGLLGGDGRLVERFLDVRLAQEAWSNRFAGPAMDAAEQGVPPSNTATGRGKDLFDQYEARHEALIGQLVDQREAALDGLRTAVLGAIAAAASVVLAAALLTIRRTRRLRLAIERPLDALLQRLADVQAGDLEPAPIPTGPAELEAIAVGVQQTVRALTAAHDELEDRADELQARIRREGEVLRLAREVAGSLSLRHVLVAVCRHAAAVAEGARVVVWFLDPRAGQLLAMADSAGPASEAVELEPVALGEGPVGLAARFGRRHGGGHDGGEPEQLALPMVVGARVMGVLEFQGPQVAQLAPEVVDVLETMAVHAATALDAACLHEETEELALTDVLTQLPNRRRLEADLQKECAASARYGRPVSFLMVDVDHFKSYNDRFGHQAGDQALQRVADVIKGALRTSDTAYRYGGEEFAVILRETSSSNAASLGERLCRAMEQTLTGAGEDRRGITISVGVAGVPDHATSPEVLIAAADEALYKAKRQGRNRVAVAGGPALAPRPAEIDLRGPEAVDDDAPEVELPAPEESATH